MLESHVRVNWKAALMTAAGISTFKKKKTLWNIFSQYTILLYTPHKYINRNVYTQYNKSRFGFFVPI